MCQRDATFCRIFARPCADAHGSTSPVDNGRSTPHSPPEDRVYQAIGDDGFRRLVRAFYRQIPADDILGPMYPAVAGGAAET